MKLDSGVNPMTKWLRKPSKPRLVYAHDWQGLTCHDRKCSLKKPVHPHPPKKIEFSLYKWRVNANAYMLGPCWVDSAGRPSTSSTKHHSGEDFGYQFLSLKIVVCFLRVVVRPWQNPFPISVRKSMGQITFDKVRSTSALGLQNLRIIHHDPSGISFCHQLPWLHWVYDFRGATHGLS